MKTRDPKTISTPPGCTRLNSFDVGGFVEKEPRKVEDNTIKGLAVITAGDAKGHGLFVDEEFVTAVALAGMEFDKGVRSRWTHGGASVDMMGKQLGRVSGFEMDGENIARGDLSFLKAASNAPGLGDISGWLMAVAQEDPGQFGASIVFTRDQEAEAAFLEANTKDGKFVSPDPNNKNNFPHVRLSELKYVDMVESPAANPEGIFAEGSELPAMLERLLDYSFGITQEEFEGAVSVFGIHPERCKEFMNHYVASRGIEKKVEVTGLEQKEEREGDTMELQDGFSLDQLFAARPDLKEQIEGQVKDGIKKSAAELTERFTAIFGKCEEICTSDAEAVEVVFEAARGCFENGYDANGLEQAVKVKLWDRSKKASDEASENVKGSLAASEQTEESEEFSDYEDELDKRAQAYVKAHGCSYSEALNKISHLMDSEKRRKGDK